MVMDDEAGGPEDDQETDHEDSTGPPDEADSITTDTRIAGARDQALQTLTSKSQRDVALPEHAHRCRLALETVRAVHSNWGKDVDLYHQPSEH
ncbi:hypothetical protein PV04_03574 [Phialophora macrospora]|uniref:Uncharacterized protein n=1 Tax=Phialophora macrospora TaxID=1851006 RepID=A0A0D2GGK9_9EURO|nr:hypothetical protein PV04_03574 [Phialophora macrospora]